MGHEEISTISSSTPLKSVGQSMGGRISVTVVAVKLPILILKFHNYALELAQFAWPQTLKSELKT